MAVSSAPWAIKGNNTERERRNFKWYFVPLLFYSVCLVISIVRHEMWRDEFQAWLIAKNSHSLHELFRNLHYEPGPVLWHLCLYLLQYLTESPVAMQIFHGFIAVAIAYVFLKYSPFSFWKKVLFIFGYFPFYEYAVISRNYSLGVLFIFIFCALYPFRKKLYLPLLLSLFFLFQTNLHSFLIGLCLLAFLIMDYLTDGKAGYAVSRRDILFGTLIILVGIAIAMARNIPPAGTSAYAAGPWRTFFDFTIFKMSLATVWDSYVPIPKTGFWNFNILNDHLRYRVLLSGFILLGSCLLFVRTPSILSLFLISSGGLIAFFYFKYLGYLRHHGQLYVMFITCLWLSSYYKPIALTNRQKFLKYVSKYKEHFIVVILISQTIAGGIAVATDWYLPFSASKEVAMYIKKNHMEDMLITGAPDWALVPVAGYLDRKIYYLSADRMGTFIVFDSKRKKQMDTQMVLEKTKELRNKYKKDFLLILNYKLGIDLDGLSYIERFTTSIVHDEKYYLYVVRGVVNLMEKVIVRGDLKASKD
jgi:hypothetical protein